MKSIMSNSRSFDQKHAIRRIVHKICDTKLRHYTAPQQE